MSARIDYAQVCASLLVIDFPLGPISRATLQNLQSSLALSDHYVTTLEQYLIGHLDDLKQLAVSIDEFYAAVEAIAALVESDFYGATASAPSHSAVMTSPTQPPHQDSVARPWLLIGLVSGFMVTGIGVAAIAAYSLVQLPPISQSPLPAQATPQPTEPVSAAIAPSPLLETAASPTPASPEANGKAEPTSQPTAQPTVGSADLEVSDRLQQLGIDPNYFQHLYQHYYPERSGSQEPATEQQERAIALVNLLAEISPEARPKLGHYLGNEALRLEARLQTLSPDHRLTDEVDQETDRQFNRLFPAWANQDLRSTGLEEVWFGIQEDVIAAREKAAQP